MASFLPRGLSRPEPASGGRNAETAAGAHRNGLAENAAEGMKRRAGRGKRRSGKKLKTRRNA